MSGSSPESVAQCDPVEVLQGNLGVTEDEARDLASIRVKCPIEGVGREASLADFMSSEHGADKAETIVDIARQAQEKGATPEDALAQALGFAATRDKDTGRLARVNSDKVETVQSESVMDKAKKKQNKSLDHEQTAKESIETDSPETIVSKLNEPDVSSHSASKTRTTQIEEMNRLKMQAQANVTQGQTILATRELDNSKNKNTKQENKQSVVIVKTKDTVDRMVPELEQQKQPANVSKSAASEELAIKTKDIKKEIPQLATAISATDVPENDPLEGAKSGILFSKEAEFDIDEAHSDVLMDQEIIFDQEVMDTFESLLELAKIEDQETSVFTLDFEEALIDDEITSPIAESTESIEKNAFVDFAIENASPKVELDIETIKAEANDNPLEETFVQLAVLLKEAPNENEDVRMAVVELSKAFMQSSNNDLQEEIIRITPEVTNKLLKLIRLVGYENPQKVLLEFVSRHDLEFLAQAIHFLGQCSYIGERHESLTVKSRLFSFADNESNTRIGKAVLSLARTRLEGLQFSAIS